MPSTEISHFDAKVKYRTVDVEGIEIFYREAGDRDAPTILLLHGFPSSSHEFRHLIPALATSGFHLVAPDLPGFGFSGFPERARFGYSFERFADVVEGFREAMGIERHALYLHDYGAHVGFRVAMRKPQRITVIAVQNAEAYDEGFHHEPLKAYWRHPSAENLARLKEILTEKGTREEFVGGLPESQVELCSPEMWRLHWPLLHRPGNIEMQLDLFADYETNEKIRPDIHRYFRDNRPQALIVWGRHEVFFTTEAAEAYRRDLPQAEIHILDAGHWALETHTPEVIDIVQRFFLRHLTD